MNQISIVTEEEAATLDRLASEAQGITRLARIDRAGELLAEAARRMLDGKVAGQEIIVLTGVGNNGAAGMAAARVLHEEGGNLRLILAAPPERLHAMAQHQLAILREAGIEPWGLGLSNEAMEAQPPVRWSGAELVIDALLGSGTTSNPRGESADLIRLVNAARRPILALDAPSGLGGDAGTIYSPCIDARVTLVLGLPRRGLVEGWPVVGELWIADTGLPPALLAEMGLPAHDPFAGEQVRSLGPARTLK